MTPEQKAIIQETWRQVVPSADQAAALFYDRLFEIDPKLRSMFVGIDLTVQRQKLVQALAKVIHALDRFEDIAPDLRALGRRHAGYGVTEQHYDTVGCALLWTLERGLGKAWTNEAAEAWANAYGLIADTMSGAADETDRATPCAAGPAVTA